MGAAPIAINLGSPLENSRGVDRVFGLFFLLSRVGLLGFCMFVFRLLLARGNGGGGYYGSIGPALAILLGLTISMTLTLFCGLVSACLKPRSSWFLLYALVLGGFVWTTVGF